MNMVLKNPWLFVLFFVFTLVNIIDLITAFFILPGESNPVYLWTGSLWFVALGKALLIILVWYIYYRNRYPTAFNYFLLTTVTMIGVATMIVAIYSNMQGIIHPDLVSVSSTISAEEKFSAYKLFVILSYILPLVFSVLSFKIWEWSLSSVKIDKKNIRRDLYD